MTIVRDIFQTINSKLPSYNQAFVKHRGLALPTDLFLNGRIRFAKKLGMTLPIWLPENVITTSKASSIVDDKLYLTTALSWIIPGSFLRIASTFLVEVDDISSDGLTILLTDTLVTDVALGADVELFSTPLEVEGTWVSPVITFAVKSTYRIYPGDEVSFGTFSYIVSSLVELPLLPDGRFYYQVTLEEAIPETLNDGSGQIYLRAFPAYESNILTLPNIPNGNGLNDIGVFLYDRISGVFFTDITVDEYDTVYLYDGTYSLITTIPNCGKNYTVYRRRIHADSFLFMDPIRGSLNWDYASKSFLAIVDEEGLFHLNYKCVPVLEPGQVAMWRTTVTPETNITMSIELEGDTRRTSIVSSVNITSSTNTTPIQVVTSTAYDLNTGATVTIAGHLVNTAANGTWTITVINETTFSLDSSIGIAAGGATGTVTFAQPNLPQVFSLLAGVPSSVNISLPIHADPVNYIHVLFQTTPVNILGSTSSTPIQVITSSDHFLNTGDTVVIEDHLGNIAANGTWVITKVNATQFTLDSSVGSGVGGATGTVGYAYKTVKMTDWEPAVTAVKFISHVTIAKTSGQVWASSPMYVKPYFFRLDYITMNADLQAALDSGLILG